ncbi:MlaE family ABC transporter permease [Rickettsiales bacterium LUAb2]
MNLLQHILNFCAFIGRYFLNLIYKLGYNIEALIIIIIKIFTPPYYFKNFINQLKEIGFYSLPVVALTSLFSGMVLALQTYTSVTSIPSENIIPSVVSISLTRELAPVLTSLMVAGRISSAISAEIGTMKVSEQLDALYTLSINSIKFLVAPRVLAGIICVPILVLFADILGIMGGYLVAVLKLDFNGVNYITNTYNAIAFYDLVSGLVKGLVFGFILTIIGCYFGYKTKNGATGVGKSTTNAVVTASILIFITDYILTVLFFGVR